MSDLNRKPLQIWECKIGECPDGSLPNAADCPMRDAVAEAYERISGHKPAFIFSGWNAELTEGERAAHENRLPRDPTPSPLTREGTTIGGSCGTAHVFLYAGTPPTPEGWPCTCGMTKYSSQAAGIFPLCDRNSYWKTQYGNCMTCRAEKAEAEVSALRLTLAQQAQEIERLEQEVEDLTGKREIQVQHNAELVEQLAAMTTARTELILDNRNLREQLTATQVKVRELEEQLATTQARVKELEAQWHYAATHDADMDYVKEIAQLHVILAAREARIKELVAVVYPVAKILDPMEGLQLEPVGWDNVQKREWNIAIKNLRQYLRETANSEIGPPQPEKE